MLFKQSSRNHLTSSNKVWQERENLIYQSLFGKMPDQIFHPIKAEDFATGGKLLVASHAGVLEIPPSAERNHWTYVTSGMSNPFDNTKGEISGYGFEFLVRAPAQSNWLIPVFFNLMGYVLETGYHLDLGYRMPLMLDNSKSEIKHLLFWPPEDLPPMFQLQSGQFKLLEVFGITEAENDYANLYSSEPIYQKLKTLPSFPVAEMTRSCLVENFLLEEAWTEREDVLYPSLFSNMTKEICVLESPEGQDDPLYWKCAGVFEIPPTSERNYWTYITSGMSNPFDNRPEEYSGYGFEFHMRVPEKSSEVMRILMNLMRYVLQTGNIFDAGHRVPLNSGSDTPLQALLFTDPYGLPHTLQLKSGKIQLLEVIGITKEEYEYAKNNSSEQLYQNLKKLPNFPMEYIARNGYIDNKNGQSM